MALGSARKFLSGILALVAAVGVLATAACQRQREPEIVARSQNETRPNVVILMADALGPELGAYGDPAAVTPNIDRLAREGVTYVAAYATSGSNGAAYASLITGMHPQTLGVVQDWTEGRAWTVAPQPEVKAFPELMRQRGWFTFRVGPDVDPFGGVAGMWDVNEREPTVTWPDVDVPQPFLGVIEVSTLPRDEAAAAAARKKKGFFERLFVKEPEDTPPPAIDAAKIVVPPYLPDTPAMRAAMQARYQRIAAFDARVGETLQRLERSGALANTVVIVAARNGPPWPRAERTLYESGVRVPLIVRYPDGRGRGTVSRALVSGADLAPSVLKLAGLQPLAWMQGRDRLSARPDPAASFVFSIQNRVGSVYERSRAVRDGRFLLILNETPQTRLLDLARRGEFYDAAVNGGPPPLGQTHPRPRLELYDLRADPQQVRNLADDPAHAASLQRMAQALMAFNAVTPDMSNATTAELRDRFRPAGETPVTAPPVLREVGGRIHMEALTPGSSIQWREDEEHPWKLYRGPVTLPKDGKLEARATRYGFRESLPQVFDARKR